MNIVFEGKPMPASERAPAHCTRESPRKLAFGEEEAHELANAER